jgi:hypothetical protein
MRKLSRLIIAYIVAIPLALVLGFLVATPGAASMAMPRSLAVLPIEIGPNLPADALAAVMLEPA